MMKAGPFSSRKGEGLYNRRSLRCSDLSLGRRSRFFRSDGRLLFVARRSVLHFIERVGYPLGRRFIVVFPFLPTSEQPSQEVTHSERFGQCFLGVRDELRDLVQDVIRIGTGRHDAVTLSKEALVNQCFRWGEVR